MLVAPGGFLFDNEIYLFYNILNKTAGKEGQDFPFRRIKTNLVSRPSGQGNRAAYLFFRLRMAIIRIIINSSYALKRTTPFRKTRNGMKSTSSGCRVNILYFLYTPAPVRAGAGFHNVKDPVFLRGPNEYGFQLSGNNVFYTAGKRHCFSYSLYL